jgi:hypothetical protein
MNSEIIKPSTLGIKRVGKRPAQRKRLRDTSVDDSENAINDLDASQNDTVGILSDFKEARKFRTRPKGLDAATLLKSTGVVDPSEGQGANDGNSLETITHGGLLDPSKYV